MYGIPTTKSGIILRIGQCVFAAVSIGVMAAASGFSTTTAFRYLIASMGLQFLWSFGQACFYIQAWRHHINLHRTTKLQLFVVGDWVTATLSLAAACSSAGVVVLYTKDTDICSVETKLSCGMFQISIAFAFVSWFLLAISSHLMFWLLAIL
ncbi:hypothetical protein BUALT_Bualt01G0041800 [Buddleja alternifolia]|uniref:CASP-like protein n=1 Tax=Buddleja alternifolia TaxID=168488 RepID=A0AAV6YEW8_9LAMI|nr:hypothetical protein BUALT_Bualt01G0041800 [Buddleja alternifolia]